MSNELIKKPVALGLVGLALTLGGFIYKKYTPRLLPPNKYQPAVALLGDVGGTNIRLELVVVKPPGDQPETIIKKETYHTKDYENFVDALQKFMEEVQVHPDVAVIAMAGPIK